MQLCHHVDIHVNYKTFDAILDHTVYAVYNLVYNLTRLTYYLLQYRMLHFLNYVTFIVRRVKQMVQLLYKNVYIRKAAWNAYIDEITILWLKHEVGFVKTGNED